MKIFRNGFCYVDHTDLERFPLPNALMMEIREQLVIEDDFLIFREQVNLNYLKDKKEILDYDEVANLSREKIDKLYQEAKRKLNIYAKRWLDTPSESRKRLSADPIYSKNYVIYNYRTQDLKNYIDNRESIDKRIDRNVNPNSEFKNEGKVLKYKISL